MTEHSDFLEEIVADDPTNRLLAAELQTWRDRNRGRGATADAGLEARFGAEAPITEPARWRQWMQRPAIAFAASFAAVLVVGLGAFSLVDRGPGGDTVAAPTSSIAALAATDEAPVEITLPSDLGAQTGYAACVFDAVTAWFTGGFSADDAPDISGTCGTPPIPDLGPGAEQFRSDLQVFANCLATELDTLLPKLPALMANGHDELKDMENKCGEPPDPRDYGLKLPFANFDWENLDLSQFNLGGFDLKGLDLENLDLEELLKNLPEGFIPKDFDLEQLRDKFGTFDFGSFDLEGCDPDSIPDFGGIDDPETFDFMEFFSEFEDGNMCGFGFFDFGSFGPGDFDLSDLEGLDLPDFDLEQLLADMGSQFGALDLEGLSLEDFNLEGFDLGKLFESLMTNGEFDIKSFLGDDQIAEFLENLHSADA